MKRPSTQERLQDLMESAVRIFGRVGYRRAQIADIARDMGIAPGTVYLYVESKEALFDRALQYSYGNAPAKEGETLPLPTPTTAGILERVQRDFTGPGFLTMVRAAIDNPAPPDIRAEFTALVNELYTQVYRRHRALKMIEASALDWPELFEFFYGVRRNIIESLTEYLTLRIRAGKLRSMPAPAAAARLILETISWFAYHRSSDPEPNSIPDEIARETVLDALVHAYILSTPESNASQY